MVLFSSGLTAAETDATGSAERKYTATSENIDAAEELVLIQEDAPGTHRNVRQISR